MSHDLRWRAQCGCTVEFLQENDYLTSHMVACDLHNKREQTKNRDLVIEEAKAWRDGVRQGWREAH